MRWHIWYKWFQRRLLDVLTTPEGCLFGLLTVIFTANSLLYVCLGPCAFVEALDVTVQKKHKGLLVTRVLIAQFQSAGNGSELAF